MDDMQTLVNRQRLKIGFWRESLFRRGWMRDRGQDFNCQQPARYLVYRLESVESLALLPEETRFLLWVDVS
ncbi:hypothetical protein OJE16_23520 [Pantoea tagorei]